MSDVRHAPGRRRRCRRCWRRAVCVPDSKPHDVPEDDRADLSGPSIGTDASGAERIYLVEPGEDQLLRSVPRKASSAPGADGDADARARTTPSSTRSTRRRSRPRCGCCRRGSSRRSCTSTSPTS